MRIDMIDTPEEAVMIEKVRKFMKYRDKVLRRREAVGDLRIHVSRPSYVTCHRLLKLHFRSCTSTRCLTCKKIDNFQEKIDKQRNDIIEDEKDIRSTFVPITALCVV
jgi:hypothetical protein